MNNITLSLNMVFWTDGKENSTRERNIKYSIKELDNLCNFLSNYFNTNYRIWDYSPTQIVKDSIHIPYPLSAFRKSEKINNILANTTETLFSIMDSDCFLYRNDYEKLAELILSNGVKSCYTFDVDDIDDKDSIQVIENIKQPEQCITTNRFPGRAGGLGAFFICNTQVIKDLGGYDEKFTTWGGEDGEVYNRIYYHNDIKKVPSRTDQIRLYHLSHLSDRENINYFNREEYIRNNY